MTQDDLLNIIHQNEGITSKEIRQKLNLGKATVSKQLSSLRKKKLVRVKGFKNSLKIYKNNNEKAK